MTEELCPKCGKGPADHWFYMIAGAEFWELVICGQPPEDMPEFHVQSNAGFYYGASNSGFEISEPQDPCLFSDEIRFPLPAFMARHSEIYRRFETGEKVTWVPIELENGEKIMFRRVDGYSNSLSGD